MGDINKSDLKKSQPPTNMSSSNFEPIEIVQHPLSTGDSSSSQQHQHQHQQEEQQQNQQKSVSNENLPSQMNTTIAIETNTDKVSPIVKKEWVKFEESESKDLSEISDTGNAISLHTTHTQQQQQPQLQPHQLTHIKQPDKASAAVLTTESVHINLNSSVTNGSTSQNSPHSVSPPKTSSHFITQSNTGNAAVIDVPIPNVNKSTTSSASSISSSHPGLRTIELSSGRVREGFANGDIIVTLLPVNTKWPWITPAVFRPELVPEELMAQGLTLTVEEYVHAMETLINDYRFTLYNICYKRILCCWILFAFSVLMGLLFSGLNGIVLFSLGVGWLFLNAAAIFLCMWMKLRLSRGLERCMASVNKQFLRHKIILVLDDRGKISCHKVNLCFMYFEPAQCVNSLNEFIARNEQNGTIIEAGWESRLDVPVNDIVIQGSNTTRVSRKQARGEELFLRYLQRWGKEFLRRRLDWIVEENGIHEMPRHLQSALCPCQFAEEILLNKPKKDARACCATCNHWMKQRGFSFT